MLSIQTLTLVAGIERAGVGGVADACFLSSVITIIVLIPALSGELNNRAADVLALLGDVL
jgi:hypothetical protein